MKVCIFINILKKKVLFGLLSNFEISDSKLNFNEKYDNQNKTKQNKTKQNKTKQK